MKAPGAMLQGGLAAVGLIAAYTTWQRAPERKAGESVIVDASASDVQKVRYEDNSGKSPKWVELERRKEEGGPRVWLHVSARTEQKTPERELRGNEAATKLFDKLAPLKATRALGVLAADKLKEVGLDAPKKHFELTVRGNKRSFSIGASPFGVSDPYVKDDADGKVYVLGGGVVSDLDGAAIRLVDRTLHDWKSAEFDALSVTAAGKTRELVQTNAETPAQAKLTSKAGKTDETAKNWHDKIMKIVVSDVLGKGEVPLHGEPQIALRVDYTSHGKKRGYIEIGRVAAKIPEPPAAGVSAPPPPPSPAELYARTETTAGGEKIGATNEDLLKEADKIAASAD